MRPLLYASRDTDASFQCDDQMIYIRNGNARAHAYVGWAIAALMIVAPFVHAWLPGQTWFAFYEHGAAGWLGLLVYLLAIGGAISAGFWWSVITADLANGNITRTSRWGLFQNRATAPVSGFTQVEVRRDVEGHTTVELTGSRRMQILWGRSFDESLRVAQQVAARLSLPLVSDGETRAAEE